MAVGATLDARRAVRPGQALRTNPALPGPIRENRFVRTIRKDWSQDGKIAALENEANASVDSMGTLSNQIFVEKKRNDVQTARIKVLSEVIEATVSSLGASGAMPKAQADALLSVLKKAMEPVKL